jgi:hypothetical protein
MSWVIVDKNFVTDAIRGGRQERVLPNGQSLIRVTSKNEDFVRQYIKFEKEDLTQSILRSETKIPNKIIENISVSELATLKTDAEGNPVYAQSKPVGDYNTAVSHNFCDKTTWINGTTDSSWALEPASGEIISIDKGEVQFAHDLQFEGNVIQLNYYVWHPVFGSVIGQTISFPTLYSIFEIGNAHWHCPAIGTEIPHGLTTIEFAQKTILELFGDAPTDGSIKLHKLEVRVVDDIELTGDYVSASFITSTRSA